MKKIILVMTMMLALSAGARDRLYIENFNITPGVPVDVYIYLDNDTTYSTFQTDLYLPDGLEIEMEDDEYFIDPVYSRLPSRTHTVSASLMPDGAIRILVLSQGVKPILGNSGAVLVMSVVATQEVNNGLVELRNSKAVEESGQKHYLDNCQAYANPGPTIIQATSIALDQETATLNEGETLQLTATVLPDDATDKSVTWSTSNAAVATVDANGLVTAVAPGTATITATTNDGSNLSASCTLTVNQPIVLASSIALNQTTAELNEGETLQLAATVLPENATDKSVTWTSSDEAVATVNANGLVTAVAPGAATITATTNDGTNLSATCAVTINPAVIFATSVALNQTTAELNEGETLQLTANVLPENATDKSVTWTSSDEAVATVNANGLVTAVAAGTATITATTNDGSNLSASCLVTIKTLSLHGDVNLDGKVDVTDVNIVVNIILGKDQAANYDGRADVNNSDNIDVSDVNILVNIILGKN